MAPSTILKGSELQKRQANFTPLSPLSMLKRTERVYGHGWPIFMGIFGAAGQR